MDKIVARTSLVAVAIVIASEAIAEPEAVRHEQGQAFCGRSRVHPLQLVDCFNQPVIKLPSNRFYETRKLSKREK